MHNTKFNREERITNKVQLKASPILIAFAEQLSFSMVEHNRFNGGSFITAMFFVKNNKALAF